MDRRAFLKSAVVGSITVGLSKGAQAAGFFPQPVDQSLFANVNRPKDPAHKTPLEKSHAPVISAPASVKAGEPFTVEVSVGENLHVMTHGHWIGYVDLLVGNDPAGRAQFEPKGYLRPKVTFSLTIPKEAAPQGKVTLVAQQRCNLHGLWEGTLDVAVK